MGTMKIIGISVLSLISVVALCFFLNALDFGLFKTFAPKYEQVRRDTFEQSQAYNEGMRRDLESATFIHRAEGYPNQLPADLQSFYQSIQ